MGTDTDRPTNAIYSIPVMERVVYAIMITSVLVIAFIALNRETFNYHTETDFLGGFLPEALRIIKGESLLVEFHPPFYSFSIAFAYFIIGNWMKAGLIVSVLFSFLLMFFGYHFFKIKFGTIEAIGSVIILIASPTYLIYSMSTTSDIFSVSLMFLSFYCIAKAFYEKKYYWTLFAGIAVGLSILTRTNGIVLIGFLLFFITIQQHRIRFNKKIIQFGVGMMLPICIWIVYAFFSNSPVMPTKTYENLALTYYSENDRITGDARVIASKDFTSSFDVILKDPGRTIKIYMKDLVNVVHNLAYNPSFIQKPIGQLAIFGFFILCLTFMFKGHFYFVVFLNMLLLFLLSNLKAFELRYYLYFLPFLGAGLANLMSIVYSKLDNKYYAKILFIIFIIGISAYSCKKAISEAYIYQKYNSSTDAHSAASCLPTKENKSGAIIISRKPHISYYSDSLRAGFPDVTTIKALQYEIGKKILPKNKKVFIFYGKIESNYRKELRNVLLGQENTPSWLEVVCTGNEEGGWVLFQVKQDKQNQALYD